MSNGIYTNAEMVDGIIKHLNDVSVSGIRSVVSLANAFSMLSGLKNGINEEAKANAQTIKLLNEQLDNLTQPQTEDGGDVVGGQHIDLNYGGEKNGKN